jgi:hypothetical protein
MVHHVNWHCDGARAADAACDWLCKKHVRPHAFVINTDQPSLNYSFVSVVQKETTCIQKDAHAQKK